MLNKNLSSLRFKIQEVFDKHHQSRNIHSSMTQTFNTQEFNSDKILDWHKTPTASRNEIEFDLFPSFGRINSFQKLEETKTVQTFLEPNDKNLQAFPIPTPKIPKDTKKSKIKIFPK